MELGLVSASAVDGDRKNDGQDETDDLDDDDGKTHGQNDVHVVIDGFDNLLVAALLVEDGAADLLADRDVLAALRAHFRLHALPAATLRDVVASRLGGSGERNHLPVADPISGLVRTATLQLLNTNQTMTAINVSVVLTDFWNTSKVTLRLSMV